jgi:hypothetical protein
LFLPSGGHKGRTYDVILHIVRHDVWRPVGAM